MKFFRSFILVIACVFMCTEQASAGFGVTPPYVTNVSLTRNSVYEQTIFLVRSDPTTDLKATISVDVPGVDSWFTINEGNEFLLPKGEQKVPMTVRVTVPEDADYKQYKGNVRVKTGAADDKVESGAVSISLGAQIDVDITVIDKKIKDFKIRKIGISDLNEGHKVGWLYFPGKIRFEMLLENTGNVPIAPSDVVFRIYERTGNVLLEETHKKGKITAVDPFSTETVFAELPTRLPSGSYIARFEIKNDEEVKLSGEVNLNVLKYGTLDAAGFGFLGLSLAHKLSIILPILAFFALCAIVFVRVRRRK
jgi:hypothetical protein